MKILHIIDSLNIGGTENLILYLFEENSKDDDNDLFLIYSHDGSLTDIIHATYKNIIKIHRKGKLDFKYIYKIRSFIKNEKIDIVHVHQPTTAFYAILASSFSKTKIVLTHHGFYNNLSAKFILYWFRSFIDVNIAVSNSMINIGKERLKYFHHLNYEVVYNGIPYKDFTNRKNIRQELNLSDGDIMICMIGNFTSDKIHNSIFKRNHLIICKALNISLRKYKNLKLIFIGRKKGQSYLECIQYCETNGISENVIYLGERNDIKDILHSFDVCVYYSKGDTFCMAIVEYMMAGVPIIVNDYEVFKEITNNGENALFFRSDDEIDISHKLSDLLEMDKNLLKQRVEKAMRFAEKTFDIKQNYKSTFNIYKKIIEND